MAEKFDIGGITFDEQGLVIHYTSSTDVRVGGRLLQTHSLHLHRSHPDYGEDMEALHLKAERILKNALEDFEESEPWVPPADDNEEDDERGMGE